MKLQLMITASAATLAHILQNLPADATVEQPGTVGNDAGPAPTPPAPVAPPAAIIPPPGDNGDDGQPNANAPAVDNTGLPWDERIHASTKATNADGSWRGKRGVDAALKASVEAELRARITPPMPTAEAAPVITPPAPQPVPIPPPPAGDNAIPTPPAPQPEPITPPAPPVMPSPPVTPVPTVPAMPVATNADNVQAATNAATGAAPDTTAAGALDFPGFMAHMAGQMSKTMPDGSPMLHADYLNSIAQKVGAAYGETLQSITDINGKPHMIQYATMLMTADGRW